MPTVNLKNNFLSESINNGSAQANYTEVYDVTADSGDGPVTVLGYPGIPAIGSQRIVDGITVWCTGRTPKRTAPGDSTTEYTVTCQFSNATQSFERDVNGNPASTPTDIVKRVDVSYERESRNVTDAEFIEVTHNGTALPNPGWFPASYNPYVGPVINSAGDAAELLQDVNRKVLRVTTYHNTWDNTWDSFTSPKPAINDAAVIITESDSSGQKFSQTFAAETLRCDDLVKDNVWRNGLLYFRRTVVLTYNPDTWRHNEVDRGQRRRVFLGQDKPDGTTYFQNDLDEIDGNHVSILTNDSEDKVAVGEPVFLNGNGTEQYIDNRITPITHPCNMVFYINPRKDFGDLSL